MRLRPYSTRPARFAAQLVGDLLMITWTALWLWVAGQAYSGVTALGAACYRLGDGAGGVAGHLSDAGTDAARIPIAGDSLAAPLRSAGGAAANIAGAGQQLGDGVSAVALPLALIVVASTILPFFVPWLLARLHFARRAGATAELARAPGGMRLLALRALTNAPAHRLVALGPDPVAGWARADVEITQALARLELHRAGVRAPSE